MSLSNGPTVTIPAGWLAFDLGVLRRLKFRSIAIPLAGEPDLGVYLKHWNVRVAASDSAQWAWTKATAVIENNRERLAENDVLMLLEDAYAPQRSELSNPSLRKWFNETDAWWFDNVRESAEQLSSATARAIALSLGMMIGDYVLSFDEDTHGLRQPLALSSVFRRVWENLPPPINNSQRNTSASGEAHEFVAEQHTDLLFLRLPRPSERRRAASVAWREEWVRGEDGFWDEMDRARAGRLGSSVGSKQQYLRFVEDLLETASHLPMWAIAHVEDRFVSIEEVIACVERVRKVEAIYSKDFSELTGARTAIIVA